jgi:hypothetical protein
MEITYCVGMNPKLKLSQSKVHDPGEKQAKRGLDHFTSTKLIINSKSMSAYSGFVLVIVVDAMSMYHSVGDYRYYYCDCMYVRLWIC